MPINYDIEYPKLQKKINELNARIEQLEAIKDLAKKYLDFLVSCEYGTLETEEIFEELQERISALDTVPEQSNEQ